LSPNAQNLAIVGYVEAYPFSGGSDVSVGGNQSPYWRGVAEVDAYGYYSLIYTNSGLYSQGGHQVHSAVDIDGNGTNFYCTGQAGGGNGLKYLNTDNELYTGQGIVSIGGTFSGTRVVGIIQGNLVFSDVDAAPIGLYGATGLPTVASSVGLLIPETNSPTDFAASPDATTIYIADNGAFGGTNAQLGGIQRWDGTPPNNYTYSYTLATGAGSIVGARALTVDFSAQSTWGNDVKGAKLYVITAEASGNRLIEIVDNGASSAATTVVTATPGELLSGVRFGPAVVPPSFAQQPESTNVPSGSPATLSASADGSGPFRYQWYFQPGGVGGFNLLNGATNSTYALNAVGSGNVGNYYVKVTSLSGTFIESQAATVGIAAPPQFTAESYLGVGVGFQVSFTGSTGAGYHLYTSTDLTQPLSNWTLLTTGSFSGGTDTYTDASGGNNPQQYYILTSP
jgi:hypothetical protein